MQQQNLGFNSQRSAQIFIPQNDHGKNGMAQQSLMYQQQPQMMSQQQPYLIGNQQLNQIQSIYHPGMGQGYSPQTTQMMPNQMSAPFIPQNYIQRGYSPAQQQWNLNQQLPSTQIPIHNHTAQMNQNMLLQNDSSIRVMNTQKLVSASEISSNPQIGIDMGKVVDLVPKSHSPNNDDSGGFYLPEYLTNEIDVKGSAQPNQQIKIPHSQLPTLVKEESERGKESFSDSIFDYQKYYKKDQKLCYLCGKEISSQDQVIDRVSDQDGTLSQAHMQCALTVLQPQAQEIPEERQSKMPYMQNMQAQISPMKQIPMVPSVNLTPDMLVFDFQLLHPMTQTMVFSLTNQSSNYIYDSPNSSYLYNKLLCSTTAVPFNMAIVKFKWDFFRDPTSMIDPYSQNGVMDLPSQPQGLHQNMIQGLVNFNDMNSHNDKNITITLKSQPFEPSLPGMPQSKLSTLHLNFNYSLLQLKQLIPPPPDTHILRNLYLSFAIQIQDFELLKQEALRLISQNPALIQLLKQPQNPIQGNQRFVSTQPGTSLHQLYQGATTPSQQELNTQFSNMSVGTPSSLGGGSNSQTLLAPTSSYQKSTFNQNSQKVYLDGFKRTGSLSPQSFNPKLFLSQEDKIKFEEQKQQKLKFTSQDFDQYDNNSNHNDENSSELQRLRKAQTCNLEVSTFDGEKNKPINQEKRKHHEIANSAGVSPKLRYDDRNSPSNFSNEGSYKNMAFGNEQIHSDFLNPLVIQKKKSEKASSKKGRKQSSNSSISVGKKSKKSTSSIKSGGSSSRLSVSSSKQDETDAETDQQIMELKGQVVEMSRQQHGSKYLQKLLARASPDFVGFAIDESLDHLHQLMVDQYGNYFCQKLLQSSSSSQRLKILNSLCPHILQISCDRKGTHSMQCLIEMINMPDEEEALKKGIKDHVIDLAFDANGTHVLQKVLLCMKEENIDFIFFPVFENLIDLSMDQNGLCVIKKIISKIQGHDKRVMIGEKLSENVVELVQSPYGNYAVQQALENWPIQYCTTIFYKLQPHLMQLSVQKFSSNVIEKVLEKAEYETVDKYMMTLCDFEVMKSLIKNTYGFFVLQKLKEVLRKHNKPTKKINQAIESTIQYVSDKSLKSKWQQLLS